MLERSEKRKLRRAIYSPLSVLVLFGLVLYLSSRVWEVYQAHSETEERLAEKQAEFGELTGRQAMLESEIARLDTERGLEEEIRAKYEVAKPGEEVLVIVDPPVIETTASPNFSWWERFVGWLGF